MPNKWLIAQVERLIEILEFTPVMTEAERASKQTLHYSATTERMSRTGEPWGDASDAIAFPNGEGVLPRDDAHIESDLGKQIQIVSRSVEKWFSTGDIPAPHYPWRVAVLLSRSKLVDHERRFLTAFCRHFGKARGKKFEQIAQREQQLRPRGGRDGMGVKHQPWQMGSNAKE